MINDVKILVVTNGENGEKISKCLEKLSTKIRGNVYLVYVKDIEPYPAEVLIELLKQYERIKRRGQKVLEDLAEKIKELGFKVDILGIQCGIVSERISKIEEQVNPDIILVEYEYSRIKRLFGDCIFDLVLEESRAPVLVAK